MNDIQKLNTIINSLEDQAKQVTEFSGLLSAVNEARIQVESSKELLKGASIDHKQFLKDSRNNFDNLERRLVAIEKTLEDFGRIQVRISEEISSFDALSPQEFSEGLRAREAVILDYLNKLEQRIEVMNISQQQGLKRSSIILLIATVSILGGVTFFGLT